MQPEDFSQDSPGRLVPARFTETRMREGKREAYTAECHAFVPNPLPPELDLGELWRQHGQLIADTERALGRLEGLAGDQVNPNLLTGAFARREAVYSSIIEETYASEEEMAMFEAASDRFNSESVRNDDVREVVNYIHALDHGLKSDLPICNRLIKDMHRLLLHNVRRDVGETGAFRKTQNAIGQRGRPVSEARFIPPPPEHVDAAMENLEAFIHDRHTELPVLVKAALMHYQFESIHPFLDGNGRLGRLLIALMLCEKNDLSRPLVYVSGFLEAHKDEYMDLLLGVSQKGQWLAWIGFFLEAVRSQSIDARERAQKLKGLQQDFHDRVRKFNTAGRLSLIINDLFRQPSTDSEHVHDLLGQTKQTAYNMIRRLEEVAILHELGDRDVNKVWYAPEIYELIFR